MLPEIPVPAGAAATRPYVTPRRRLDTRSRCTRASTVSLNSACARRHEPPGHTALSPWWPRLRTRLRSSYLFHHTISTVPNKAQAITPRFSAGGGQEPRRTRLGGALGAGLAVEQRPRVLERPFVAELIRGVSTGGPAGAGGLHHCLRPSRRTSIRISAPRERRAR